MSLTESERKISEWILGKGISLPEWFEASDDERRQMAKDLAQTHYSKGRTENFQRQLDKAELWKDVAPIVSDKAEEKVVDPKLAALERITGEVNTRREIRSAREDYGAIPREKLSEPRRVERYDKIGNTLSTIETVMTEAEAEAALLRRTPLFTDEERREENANYLLRQARAAGVTSAGGSVVGTPNVRYRTDTAPQPFIIREYPAQYDPRTQTWNEESRYRVYREDTGEYLGQFSEKPTAKQIREKWRS